MRDKNPKAAPGQGELFPAWRYHAVFTDSPFETVQAEEQHRGHAVIEHGRGRLALHLPEGWHREREWLNLFETDCGPSAAAA